MGKCSRSKGSREAEAFPVQGVTGWVVEVVGGGGRWKWVVEVVGGGGKWRW